MGTTENDKLLAFLQEQYAEYQDNILPICSQSSQSDDAGYEFDDAKNEFLESLWDVIKQHFDDVTTVKMRRYEFTITLSGQGNCADGAWVDAVNSFGGDPGTPDEDQTKVFEI